MNLFSEPTYNRMMFFGLSLLSGLVIGPILIPRLTALKFGQAIREEGPQSHLHKTGTPTMGGIIFLLAFMVPLLITLAFENMETLFVICATFTFGAIGFLDDYLKVVKKHNEGLKAKQKIVLQSAASLIFALFALNWGTTTYVPFIDQPINLGLAFVPLIFIVLIATDNAVNLTDGLDGLSATVTLVVSMFFAAMGLKQHNEIIVLIALAMSGGLLAYLKFNWHPAKVFMGDTGSLALGGYVAAMAILLNMPLFIPLFGLIYFIETLSVMLQVGYYKKTKKRIFKMAPIHHHFELSGWNEVQIVSTFSAITLIMCIISYFIF